MARLPAIDYGGAPQTLGREDISLPAQLAQARAGIAKEVAANVTEGITLWDRETQRQADVNTANRMLDFESKHRGKQFYNGDELPDDIPEEIRYQTIDGERVARQNIPAYQVYPQLLEIEQRKVLEEEGEGILLPRSRDMWMADKEITAQQRQLEAAASAREQQAAQIQAAEIYDINQAIDNRRYGLAAELIERYTGTDLDKKKMREEMLDRQETDTLDQMMVSEDVAGMTQAIENLSEGKTNLPANKARQYAKMMRVELKRIENNEKAKKVGARAEGIVDEVIAQGGTNQEQYDRIRARDDISQEYKDEALKRAKIRHAETEAQRRITERELVNRRWEKMREAPSMEHITPDLPTDTQNAMYQYALKRAQGPIVTDRRKEYELSQIVAKDFEAFKEINLMDWSPYLDDADFDKYVTLQRKRPTDPSVSTGQTLNQQVNNAIVGLGWDPKWAKKTGEKGERVIAFKNLVDSELAAEAEAKGRKLTPVERLEVIDRLSMQEVKERPWYRPDEELGVDDIGEDGIPHLGYFTEMLRYKGQPVTGPNLYRIYSQAKENKTGPFSTPGAATQSRHKKPPRQR